MRCIVCKSELHPPSEPPHCEDCLLDPEADYTEEELAAAWSSGKVDDLCRRYPHAVGALLTAAALESKRWHPASKPPPPAPESEGGYSELVLLHGPGDGLDGRGVGFYHHESKLWIGLRVVTHWQPLPAPPGDKP